MRFESCLVDEALEADGEGVPDGARLAGGSARVNYHAHVHQVHEARELEGVKYLGTEMIQFSVRSTLYLLVFILYSPACDPAGRRSR